MRYCLKAEQIFPSAKQHLANRITQAGAAQIYTGALRKRTEAMYSVPSGADGFKYFHITVSPLHNFLSAVAVVFLSRRPVSRTVKELPKLDAVLRQAVFYPRGISSYCLRPTIPSPSCFFKDDEILMLPTV